MPERALPTELVSLVHHIELNQVGWWDVVVQRLIIACIWLTGKPLTVAEILEKGRDLEVGLTQEKVESQVGRLVQTGELKRLAGSRLKISESAHRELDKEMEAAEEVQQDAEKRFLEIVKNECPSLDPQETWVALNEELLLPAIREMGCRFYSLIAEQGIEIDSLPTLDAFLSRYSPEVSGELRTAVTTYFCAGDRQVKSYILHYLSAYFFVEAGRLSDQTIQSLIQLMEKPPRLRIFTDTNFIFSALGVRPNPSNEAAQTALELADQLSGAVDVQFRALPITLKETRAAIQLRLDDLKDVCMTPNLAQATLRRDVGGFVRRLAEEVERVGQSLTGRDLFEPYAKNLLPLAKSHGIQFEDVDLGDYYNDERVIDDLNTQLEREQEKGGHHAKGYAQLKHDIILWYFVYDQRADFIESPAEAEYWVVTVDYRFLGYDAYKIQALGEQIPVSLHPTALIQLLQFWLPRPAKREETLYSSWLWPLLFPVFDAEAEEVTIRILRSLSRFENIEDLPAAAVDNVLLNKALRQRISTEDETAEQIEIVREALITEAQRASKESQAQQKRADKAERQVVDLSEELKRQREENLAQAEALADARDRARQKDQIEDRLRRVETQERMRKFVAQWVVLPLLLSFALAVAGGYASSRYLGGGFGRAVALAWVGLLIPVIWLIHRRGQDNEAVANTRWFHRLVRFKIKLFGILGAILLGLIVDLLKEVIFPPSAREWLRNRFSSS